MKLTWIEWLIVFAIFGVGLSMVLGSKGERIKEDGSLPRGVRSFSDGQARCYVYNGYGISCYQHREFQ